MNTEIRSTTVLLLLTIGWSSSISAAPPVDPLCVAAGPSGSRSCRPADVRHPQADGQLLLVAPAPGNPVLSEDSSRFSWRNGQSNYQRPKIGNEDGTIPPVEALSGMGIRRN